MNNDILTEMRNRFSFLRSYLETIESLPSDKDKLAVFMAIARYGLDNEIPDFSGMESACYLNAIWRSLVRNIDSSIAKQQSPGPPIGSNNNPNGRRGKGREQESSSEQAERKEQAQSDTAPEPEEQKRTAKAFVPPTVEEVEAYTTQRGFIDPKGFALHFVTYYTEGEQKWHLSNGKPMRDWKKAVITWEPNNKQRIFQSQPTQAPLPQANQRQMKSPEDFQREFEQRFI